jgi:hemoglobin-like flavoprotein
MALTSDEGELIRSSFRQVSRDRQEAAARFYEILFETAPETRDLFVNSIEQQGAELMSKLGLIVAEIQNIEGLVPVLEDLALRHVAYGVKPEHYPLVGVALQQMLAEFLGDDFTPETRAAWAKAYDDLSSLMIRSAYSHDRPVTAS